MPASWSPGGFTALFVEETPEVRFDDVMVATLYETTVNLPIDPHYLQVCEPGSVEVCGCVPDVPVLVGAVVDGDAVRVRLIPNPQSPSPVRVVLRLTGIRRGFRGLRFPDRTRAQFEANERFIKSGHPQ